MNEADRLQKQWDEGFVASVLGDIGFNQNEINLTNQILKKENIPLKALLRQALRTWQGESAGWNKDGLKVFSETECRATFDPQIGNWTATFYGEPVESIDQAKAQLEVIANYTLHLHENNLMEDHSNAGFIEQRVDGGPWEEIEQE